MFNESLMESISGVVGDPTGNIITPDGVRFTEDTDRLVYPPHIKPMQLNQTSTVIVTTKFDVKK